MFVSISWRAAVMMKLRRHLRGGAAAGATFLVLLFGLLLLPAPRADACWNTVLVECFNQVGAGQFPRCDTGWPFQSPAFSGRYWRHWPNPPYGPSNMAWGFQTNYFDDSMCPTDDQALWCVGCPPSNDPEYNLYPANLNTYVVYGPINLSAAVAAYSSFFLYNRSEQTRDSVFWGASPTWDIQNNNALMNVAGMHSGIMLNMFEPRTMDLSRLRNLASGDSVSMLGQSQVYVFWRFRADGNNVRNVGAFLDNVTIAWDDGGIDIWAQAATLLKIDTSLAVEPQFGDTVFAVFDWSTCSGGGTDYAPFRITGVTGDLVVLDTVISNPGPGMNGRLFTDGWVLNTWGENRLRFVVDTLQQVAEVNETNNVAEIVFNVLPPNYPPDFTWIAPDADTLRGDTAVWLRWTATDTAETAMLMFYRDIDAVGCTGILLPGGIRDEIDGPDSLLVELRNDPHGRLIYPFVRIIDETHNICLYSPAPIQVYRPSAVEPRPGELPAEFYLAQNYPNPFNPATEFRYGLTTSGPVTLKVFDLLGREVIELVNADLPAGTYTANFDGARLPSGVYLYTLTAPEATQTRKMMLLK